jgi:hypothetical protein
MFFRKHRPPITADRRVVASRQLWAGMWVPFGEKIAQSKPMLYDTGMAEPGVSKQRFHRGTWVIVAAFAAELIWLNVDHSGWPYQCYVPYIPRGEHLDSRWTFILLVKDVFFDLGLLVLAAWLFEFWRRVGLGMRLSTAVVLMIGAALIIWANLNESLIQNQFGTFAKRGWPWSYFREYSQTPAGNTRQFVWILLLGNIQVAILILGSVGAVSEMLVRRKSHG